MSKDHKNCLDYTQFPSSFLAQHQSYQPGIESEMMPLPIFDDPCYVGCNRLLNKVALITGGDSGIGRAVAVAFAKKGQNLLFPIFMKKRIMKSRSTIINTASITAYEGEQKLIDYSATKGALVAFTRSLKAYSS